MSSQKAYIEYYTKKHGCSKASVQRQLKEKLKKWNARSDSVMKGLLRSKFSHPILKKLLKETGDTPLHEIGRPGHWTVAGDDALGELLCELRSEIH